MRISTLVPWQDQVTPDNLSLWEIWLRKAEFLDITTIWWFVGFTAAAVVFIVLAIFVKPRWWLFLFIPLIVLSMTAAAGFYFNHEFKYKTTMGKLFGLTDYDTGDDNQFTNPTGDWPRGLVVTTSIPGTTSGVGDWKAMVWLPPQYFTNPDQKFPVIYLLHGVPDGVVPGLPTDVGPAGLFEPIKTDDAAQAAADQGHPVILVSVVSSPTNIDTECVDGVQGKWHTYLTKDVPAWVSQFPRFKTGAENTAVGGYSMGGYCAQIMALRNPQTYSLAANLSGSSKAVPRGGGDEVLFGAENAQKEAINYDSTNVVQTQPASRSVRLWLEIGAQDDATLIASQKDFAAAATNVGMTVVSKQIPGSHDFAVWRTSFAEWIPWSAAQLYGTAPTSNNAAPSGGTGGSANPSAAATTGPTNTANATATPTASTR